MEERKGMRTALSITGTDPCGGAGIQADLKTMTMNGVYAMSVVTMLEARNTTGIKGMMEITPEFLQQQMDAVFEDIFPDAVKIGMVFSGSLIEVIADRLRHYKAGNIVLDPVMAVSGRDGQACEEGIAAMKKELLPLATVVTPNIPESEILSGMTVSNFRDMEKAARHISETYGCAVFIKGGRRAQDVNDLLYVDGAAHWYTGRRIANPNTYGSGCVLSGGIAANLAKGYNLPAAVRRSKDYLTEALTAMLDLGKGSGPLNLAFGLQGEYAKSVCEANQTLSDSQNELSGGRNETKELALDWLDSRR